MAQLSSDTAGLAEELITRFTPTIQTCAASRRKHTHTLSLSLSLHLTHTHTLSMHVLLTHTHTPCIKRHLYHSLSEARQRQLYHAKLTWVLLGGWRTFNTHCHNSDHKQLDIATSRASNTFLRTNEHMQLCPHIYKHSKGCCTSHSPNMAINRNPKKLSVLVWHKHVEYVLSFTDITLLDMAS